MLSVIDRNLFKMLAFLKSRPKGIWFFWMYISILYWFDKCHLFHFFLWTSNVEKTFMYFCLALKLTKRKVYSDYFVFVSTTWEQNIRKQFQMQCLLFTHTVNVVKSSHLTSFDIKTFPILLSMCSVSNLCHFLQICWDSFTSNNTCKRHHGCFLCKTQSK